GLQRPAPGVQATGAPRESGPDEALVLGQPCAGSPQRQNTARSDSPAGQGTMVDPPHPRSGHPLPRRRVPSRRSKARRVVQRPDGRGQWLPHAGTELDASAGAAPPPARMAVPPLRPLAPLGGARLTGKESRPPDTAPALPRRVVHAPLTVPLNESRGAPDLVEQTGPTWAAATGPRPLRPHAAAAGGPGHGGPGAPPCSGRRGARS